MEIKTRVKCDFHVMVRKNGIAFIRADIPSEATQRANVSCLLLISPVLQAHGHSDTDTQTWKSIMLDRGTQTPIHSSVIRWRFGVMVALVVELTKLHYIEPG